MAKDPNAFDPATFKRAKGYVVVAPYVTLTTATPQGKRLVGLHAGAPVPPDVPDSQVFYHLRDGMVVEADEPGAVPDAAINPSPQEQMEMGQAGETRADRVRAAVREMPRPKPAKPAGQPGEATPAGQPGTAPAGVAKPGATQGKA
jgi:hypothetical protein